jgi:signal peptide peptidase SppA
MSKQPLHNYDHLAAYAVTHPWALEPEMLAVVVSIVSRRLAGDDTHPDVVALSNKRELAPAPKGVAVLPMYGVIAPKMNMFSEISGGTTFQQATAQLQEAVASKDVSTIVLDWDSPGGNVQGAKEFADAIMKAKTIKPVISQVNYRMCSAAYWVGACATKIVAAPSGVVGAIGVYTIHNDLSKALADLGVKRTYLSKGKFKVEGNETEPLADDTKARWLAEMEVPYTNFINAVAHGRGVSPAAVRGGFGEGRAVQADEALALGMIDSIATLDETLIRLTTATTATQATVRADAPTSQTPSEVDETARISERAWRASVERQLLTLAVS